MYLEFMKSHLQIPDRYFKSNSIKDCVNCTFKNHCAFTNVQKRNIKLTSLPRNPLSLFNYSLAT